MPGIVSFGTYRPPLPNGYPGVTLAVGRTSTNPLNVATILADNGTGANNLPSGWTYAAGSKRIFVNGNATDWDFRGIDARYDISVGNVILSQCLFDLSNYTVDNLAFITNGLAGRYYSVVNCEFHGLAAAKNVTAMLAGSVVLVEGTLVTRWPQDFANPAPLSARPNSTAVSLGFGYGVASNPGLDFICTTAGTTASSEPAGYATAVNGGTVTDGTAVFTAQNTKHIFQNNSIDIASSGPLHPDGIQINSQTFARGAHMRITNNIIDLSRPVTDEATSWPINIGGGGSNIAIDIDVDNNVLLGAVNTVICAWGSGGTITGNGRYTNNYGNSIGSGIFYTGSDVGDNFTMSGWKHFATGAPMTFSVREGGVTTSGLSSYP